MLEKTEKLDCGCPEMAGPPWRTVWLLLERGNTIPCDPATPLWVCTPRKGKQKRGGLSEHPHSQQQQHALWSEAGSHLSAHGQVVGAQNVASAHDGGRPALKRKEVLLPAAWWAWRTLF